MRLSVAIPTYNRAHFLKANILNLLDQISRLDELIGIVVSDNASTDGTDAMVMHLIEGGAPINYYRNDVNLGMDENADLAIKRSVGEYVLLLGDDDMLEPCALRAIIQCLKSYPNVGLIYLNFKIYDKNLEKEVDFRDLAFDPIEVDTFFSDGLAVIEKTKKIFAAISGGVYRRALWEQADPKRFYGTIFIHVGVTMDILCRMRQPAYVFKQPLFRYRLNDSAPGEIKSYKDIFAVSFGLLRILTTYKKYISFSVFNEVYERELKWTREKILGAKARETVPVSSTIGLMKRSYDVSRIDFWILDLPMLLAPKWFLALPYRLYRLIKYRGD